MNRHVFFFHSLYIRDHFAVSNRKIKQYKSNELKYDDPNAKSKMEKSCFIDPGEEKKNLIAALFSCHLSQKYNNEKLNRRGKL